MVDPDDEPQTAQISPDTDPASNMNNSPNLTETTAAAAAPTNLNTSTQCSNETTISSLITESSIANLNDFDDDWTATPAGPANDYLLNPPTTLDTIHFDYEQILREANFVHPNKPTTLDMNTFD